MALQVRKMETSLRFWRDLLGFRVLATGPAMASLASATRDQSELILVEVGEAPGPARGKRRGVRHIGIKVGESLEELRQAKAELQSRGVLCHGATQQATRWSLHLEDPDGNEVELYCDRAGTVPSDASGPQPLQM